MNKEQIIKEQRKMNNEQRGMRSERGARNIVLPLFFILCSLFILSCNNVFNAPVTGHNPGMGTIVLSINGGAGRTIMPDIGIGDFVEFALDFVAMTAGHDDFDDTLTTPTGTVELPVGTEWELTVTAYFAGGIEATKSEPQIITVPSSSPIPVNVLLLPIEDGEGTFSWIIGFDGNFQSAVMEIYRGDDNVIEALEDTVDLIIGGELQDNDTGFADLTAGEYLVVFVLSNGTDTVEIWETLHIYQNMESIFEYTFTNKYFHVNLLHFILASLNDLEQMLADGITEEHFEMVGIAGIDEDNFEAILGAFDTLLASSVPTTEAGLKALTDAALITIGADEDFLDAAQYVTSIDANEAIQNLTANGTHITIVWDDDASATVTVGNYTVEIAFNDNIASPFDYIIAGSGTTFTATRYGKIIEGANGVTIANAINAIRTDAAGADCSITFGTGNVLNIGAVTAGFSGANLWGKITLLGSIVSTSTTAGVTFSDNVSAESYADIRNDVGQYTGRAIGISGTATLAVKGGTVSARIGYAMAISGSAKVSISGSETVVTSQYDFYPTYPGGTIDLSSNAAFALEINGGTIRNTSVRADAVSSIGHVIYNRSSRNDAILMSGGTMECANPERGFTIYHTNANGGLVLSGNPTIIGRIMGDRGRLSVLPGFEPSEDTIYRMHYTSFTSGVVVAGNAGNFPGNFTINNSDFILMASGADLIMKSVLDYSYTRAGSTYTIFQIAGGEYLTMQSVIEAIKEEAGSAPCTIRFGNDSVVNIVSETVRLDNASGTWGTITLQGQISSINVAANQGTVTIADDVSVHSQADIANTGTGRAISHTGTGTVTISDGTVSAATGQAIFNNGTGTVNVSGGTVSAVTGRAIENTNTGRINISGTAIVTSGNASESVAGVNTAGTILISGTQAAGTRLEISGNAVVRNTGSTDMSRAIYNSSTNGVISITGGTVSAAAGRAIENANTGRITISGTALVTSENVSSSSGTVFISGTQAAGTRLEINGGTVRNTSTVANGNVVYNTSTNGAVHISGGTVSTTATNGFALQQTNANAQLVLGGNPQISGTAGIRVPVGRLTVSTSANPVGDVPAFAPSVGRTYQLNFSSYSLDMIAVQNGGAFRNNFVLLNLRLDWGTIVDNGNLVVAAYNAFDYVRNGTTYTVTRSLSSSFANIQEVINAIRTAAGGTACTIQFGDENFNLLGIDANPVLFDGAWGIITLRGKITSSSSQGTIMFADNVSVNSEADIANTGSNSNGIVNNGTGTISIISGIITSSSGAILNNVAGTISVLGGTITSISPSNNSIVISNTGAGTINVSGGTITSASVTFSSAISNSGTGTINVSGGTVLGMSSASWAIRNTGTGTVYISGTADVASSNANGAWGGTISISIAQAAGTRLVISGGTVRNTSTTADGDAIYNNSTNGAVHITGGTISTTAANGFAIQHTEPNTQLVLGGNPDISGGLGIRVLAGRLSVATPANPVSGVPAFTPSAGRNYSLNYPSYTHNMVVVANGGIFRNFFTIYNQPYIELAFSDNNLIAKMNDYTFTKDGTTYIITETDEPGYSSIQTLINAIRTDADGQDCTIQFGSDGNVLNIHWSSISFNGSWGTVTLLGKITSLNAVGTEGTIVAAGVSINSQADITNASNNGRAINNTGTGTVTVSGGTVSCGTNASGNGIAILNAAAGEIIISGGTVMSNTGTNGGTISNSGAGTVTISEGTVSSGTSMTIANENVGAIIIDGGTVSSNADRGRTIVNTNAGTVSISGTAVVTSLNTNGFEGTINVSGTQAAGIRLEISGNAVVSNMAGGNTIYNSSGNGAVHINGGTVSTVSASGYAIRNTATNTMLVLDNSPAISGMILVMSTASAGRLSLGDSFVPNGTYTLEFSGTLTNIIAVVDGADFADSFELAASRQAAWKLEAEDGNLLVKSR